MIENLLFQAGSTAVGTATILAVMWRWLDKVSKKQERLIQCAHRLRGTQVKIVQLFLQLHPNDAKHVFTDEDKEVLEV